MRHHASTPANIFHTTPAAITRRRALGQALGAGAALALPVIARAADAQQPGRGVKVLPLKSSLVDESFQTLLVMRALAELGYDVQPYEEVEYPLAHLAVARGDATLIANHWNPHHSEFYKAAGGDAALYRRGVYSAGAAQGYMIDRRSAEQYGITHIDQLQDPKLAQLFDMRGKGRASLVGPNAGWGGEAVVYHQIKTFGLQDTVEYVQGNYPALISETIARHQAGKPVLYYAWTPYWLSNVLRPGRDAVWLQVPRSAMPGVQAGIDTALPNGRNYGFPLNNQHIVTSQAWAREHPAAARLFAVMQVSVDDISAQNKLVHDGQRKPRDIQQHADRWIAAHRQDFDAWLAQARAAAA